MFTVPTFEVNLFPFEGNFVAVPKSMILIVALEAFESRSKFSGFKSLKQDLILGPKMESPKVLTCEHSGDHVNKLRLTVFVSYKLRLQLQKKISISECGQRVHPQKNVYAKQQRMGFQNFIGRGGKKGKAIAYSVIRK